MTTTQFNVRIDANTKTLGDEAFSSINYTPSRIVQEVWGFAARNRRSKKALRQLVDLVAAPAEEPASERERKARLIEDGPGILLRMLAENGVENPESIVLPSDEDLLYQAYLDKMAERGMSA